MKALQTEIKNIIHSHIAVVERDEAFFNAPFHFHPEIELVYILESNGKRIIGDKLDYFSPGDMVFIGPGLPHVWINGDEYYQNNLTSDMRAKAIVVYFNKEIFSKSFYELEETTKISDLFNRSARGLKINGKTRQSIADKMQKLTRKQGFERFIALLEILNLVASSKEIEYIASEGYAGTHQTKTDRLAEVYKYIADNYSNDISLENVAKIANMTPTAFCRLFKQRTNRHFVEYVNEVRISNACRYLVQTSLNISEIAFQCGYKTLSNFNKIFKKTTNLSPKQYREKTSMDMIVAGT